MDKESLLAKDWFEKAAKDLKRVDVLMAAEDEEGAGFHLQQAAEKYLKGYLLGRGWPVKRTHDLVHLLEEALKYDQHFEKFREACRLVSQYYVEQRYPFPYPSGPSREALQAAITNIKQMVTHILREEER